MQQAKIVCSTSFLVGCTDSVLWILVSNIISDRVHSLFFSRDAPTFCFDGMYQHCFVDSAFKFCFRWDVQICF